MACLSGKQTPKEPHPTVQSAKERGDAENQPREASVTDFEIRIQIKGSLKTF
jgi:hypothetical protein